MINLRVGWRPRLSKGLGRFAQDGGGVRSRIRSHFCLSDVQKGGGYMLLHVICFAEARFRDVELSFRV